MAHKNTSNPKEADASLEANVDAMMEINPDNTSGASSEPLDIFDGSQSPIDEISTAPLLPGQSRHTTKTVTTTKIVSAEPETEPVSPAEVSSEDSTIRELEITPLAIDTPQTDAAIDDIVAQEADQVLAAQDAGILTANAEASEQNEAPVRKGHPVFWFVVLVLSVIAFMAAYVLTSPGLELPFN